MFLGGKKNKKNTSVSVSITWLKPWRYQIYVLSHLMNHFLKSDLPLSLTYGWIWKILQRWKFFFWKFSNCVNDLEMIDSLAASVSDKNNIQKAFERLHLIIYY